MNEAPDDSLPYFDRNIGDLLIQMVNEQNRYLLLKQNLLQDVRV